MNPNISELQQMVMAQDKDLALRRALEGAGVQLSRSNFYSNVPSLADLEQSFEYASEDPAEAPYLRALNPSKDLLATWLGRLAPHTRKFNPSLKDDEVAPKGYFLENSQFSHSDAFAYWAMLREVKPKKVVEIGGGLRG
jgi:hypothetical protein